MSEEKFCPACEDYREFALERRQENYVIRGRDIEIPVTIEVCRTCGESLFDESRDEELLKRAYGEYRKIEGLLAPDEIKAIRKRYRLSQKSFAALLGMSEATINRYEQGSLQDRPHDSAIRACETWEYMRDLILRNGKVLSDWQRKRVQQAIAAEPGETQDLPLHINLMEYSSMPSEVSRRTGFRTFSYDRYAAVVVWFCRNLRTAVTQTKLYKLLFYADFLAFKAMAVSLTGAAYRRLQYGPVPADYGNLRDRLEYDDYVTIKEVVYQNGRTAEEYHLGPKADEVSCEFRPEELAVLKRVAQDFRNETPSETSARSHRESAWLRTPEKELISYEEAVNLSLSLAE